MGARVRLTGEMQVETPLGLVGATDFPGRQGRVVFARLASTPNPVRRDELADVVWPDRLPRSWERDLSAIVSKIRALLVAVGLDDPIAAAFGCYQLKLGAEAHVDVIDAMCYVEDAEAALRRGDLLGAHAAGDVATNHCLRPFLPGEDGGWIAARRGEQHELLLRALDVLVQVHIRRRIFPEARRYANQLIELEPYRESGYAALMRAQVAAGDRGDALKTYERARTLLVEELGASPGEVLEAAYQQALAPEVAAASGNARSLLPTGTVTLLFTDLVASTALAEALDPNDANDLRRHHFALLRDILAMHSGVEVKSLGDGLMVVFASATDAVACAIGMQQAVEHANRTAEIPMAMRIGLHTGEPTVDEGDYFGIPVAIAKRVCDAAEGPAILASDLVRSLAATWAPFVDRRDLLLKGMSVETTVWTVQWTPWEEPRASQISPGRGRSTGSSPRTSG